MSDTATYADFWAQVQQRAPLPAVLVLLLALVLFMVAGIRREEQHAQLARDVQTFYQEETRRLYSDLALCRQPPPRSLAVRTHEGATHDEDVGGTRGSSHWLGTIHHPEQPPRRNGPPEGEAAKP